LIEEGATELPITDERMTRFWITLQQGVNFVLSSLGMMSGGEIFVPKIPSMRIVDLARCMAPDIKHRVVGIRPGEKLHEVMVTEDDARVTRDLPDRYVIEPALMSRERSSRPWMSAPLLSEGFRYASDTNVDWLEAGDMRKFLQAS
jgi:UDP-N-acetylglucosamine 4,6-dehydratase